MSQGLTLRIVFDLLVEAGAGTGIYIRHEQNDGRRNGETLIGNHSRQVPWHTGVKTKGLSDLLDISHTVPNFERKSLHTQA